MNYAQISSSNIKRLIATLGISITQLAEKIDIPQTTLNASLNSKKGVPIDVMIKIADFFNTTVPLLCDISKDNEEEVTTEAMEVARAYDAAPLKDKKMVCLTLDLPKPTCSTEPRKPELSAFGADTEAAEELSPDIADKVRIYQALLEAEEKGMTDSEGSHKLKGA